MSIRLAQLLSGGEVGEPQGLGSVGLASVGAVLALSGIAGSPFVAQLVRRIFPGRNVIFARWGFTHLACAVLAFVALQVVASRLWPLAPDAGLDEVLARSALAFAVPAGVAIAYARRLSPDGVAALGFRRGRNARAVAAGLSAYVLLGPGVIGLGLVWPWAVEQLGGDYDAQAAARGFLALSGAGLWISIALAVLALPLLEELLFRGFLQPLLVQNFRDGGGIVLTSLLFAALHGWDASLPIFGLSLLLGGIMLRTQRLVACWAVHGLHNAVAIALLLGSEEMRNMLPQGVVFPFPR